MRKSLDDVDDIVLYAVDSNTGNIITNLIYFNYHGTVLLWNDACETLKNNGYNPYEYGNTFDEDGAICIE